MCLLSPSSSAVLDANALAAQQGPGMENSSKLAVQLLQQRPRSAPRAGEVTSAAAAAGAAAAAAAPAAAGTNAPGNVAVSITAATAAVGLAAAVNAEQQQRAVFMVSKRGS
jgi:hypothetical protein